MKTLKYWILLLTFFWLILSCTDTDVITFDNCQYIRTTSNTGQGPVVSLAHKGNCNNPIHKKDTIYNQMK